MTTTDSTQSSESLKRNSALKYLAIAIAIIIVGMVAKSQLSWVVKYPRKWVIPLKDWISNFFEWIVYEVKFFEGTPYEFIPTDITRGFVTVMEYPLNFMENLFFKGFQSGADPLPWVTFVGLSFILGYWVAGWRTSLVVGGGFLYLALFSVWQPSMDTFSLVIITVPFVFIIGLFLGISIAKSKRAEAFFTPVFDLMQAMPPFAYMVPIVVMYGIGDVPAMIATAVFAIPPVARCVALGLKTVPANVVEAGYMMGCTERQLLWRVKVPTARKTIVVGLNQGIMQTLAMVVLASTIGASGLGSKLLNSLQKLNLGEALEQGVAIVVIAIALDRLSAAYAGRPPQYMDKSLPWHKKTPVYGYSNHIHCSFFTDILFRTSFKSIT